MSRTTQIVALMVLATVMQAQETYTAYRIESFSFDNTKNIIIWSLSARVVDADGKTLETLQTEVPYVLELETGLLTRLKAAGYVQPYIHAVIGRELWHVRKLLVGISAALNEGQPPERDVRASAR